LLALGLYFRVDFFAEDFFALDRFAVVFRPPLVRELDFRAAMGSSGIG
jgi:hypothetical protein